MSKRLLDNEVGRAIVVNVQRRYRKSIFRGFECEFSVVTGREMDFDTEAVATLE